MDISFQLYTLIVLFVVLFKHGIAGLDFQNDYYGSPLVLDSVLENKDQYIDMYTLPKSRITLMGTTKEIESSLKHLKPSGWCDTFLI